MNIMTLLDTATDMCQILFHTTYQNAEEQGYFNDDIPGVGTPFPKIGEMDYSNGGLEFATGGEDRINPGVIYACVDALRYSIDPSHKRLDDNVAKEHVPLMRAPWPMTGEVNRRNVINPYLEKLPGTVRASQSAPC